MAKPIELTFTANARQLLKTTDNIDEAFNEVADSLDNVATDSGRSADKMADSVDDAAKSIKKDASELERSFKEVGNSMSESASKGGRALATETRKGTDDAKGSLAELKDEAKQNIAETASSFDGSLSSLGDTIQGTLGGVIASLPPQFAILAAAGAVAFGVISSKLEEGEVAAEAQRETIAALKDEYIDMGEVGAVSLDFLISRIRELSSESADGTVDLADLARTAKGAKSDFQDLAQAYAGNSDELNKLVKEGKAHADQLEEEASNLDTTTEAGNRLYGELQRRAAAQEKYNAYLATAKTNADTAAEAARLYAEAGGPAMEAKAEQIKTVNAAYDESAGNLEDYLTKEGKLFDVAKYVKAMEARSKALADYQANLASADLSDDAKAFLNEQGADAAASFLAGYQKATPEQKAKLNDIWSEAGKDNSGEYIKSTQAGLDAAKDLTPPKVKTPKVDVKELLRNAQRDLDTAAPLKMTVVPVDRNGKEVK